MIIQKKLDGIYKMFCMEYFGVVSLCQGTNCQCDNSPTFVLQNSELPKQNFAVQRLANCYNCDNLIFDKVICLLLFLAKTENFL